MENIYQISAYYDEAFRCLHYAKTVNDWSEVEEFIWEYVQKGFNCLIIEHKTGKRRYAFAEDFDDFTVEPREIIRDTTKDWRKQNVPTI